VLPAPAEFATEAGLEWVSDSAPGIRREARGKGFGYRLANGKAVSDRATLDRIKALVIPPAWREVWICLSARGHIQATGRDARGRKQYKYHPHWRRTRDETKFDRMIAFGKVLPAIRRRTQRDLRLEGLPREKVLAAIVQLLEKTLIRVGNDEYARTNNHYGLTTMRNRHARVRAGTIRFEFLGKSGVEQAVELDDPRLAKIVRACQELPNQELFSYVPGDGRKYVDVTSGDVNAYLREVSGDDFTAKDFRTWAGTVLAAQALKEVAAFESQAEGARNVVSAVKAVAKRLGNTPAVCRKCYIHPAIIEAYLDGSLGTALGKGVAVKGKRRAQLRAEEAAVFAFLEGRGEGLEKAA
jgi:DNA topoisomerase-1